MGLFRRREREEDPAVTAEVERIATLLRGGPLTGRPVSALSVPGSDDIALAVEIDPGEVRRAWRAARSLLDQTGRWPVAVATPEKQLDGKDLFSRWGFDERPPSEVVARAADLTPAAALEHCRDDEHLEYLREIESSDDDEDEPGGHLDWYEPVHDLAAIAFLPTPASEDTVAFVDFFGMDGVEGHAALLAILRDWRTRFDAEVVAAWGTMLQFVVGRPPEDLDAALALAEEQASVASDTLMLPGVSIEDHARALVGRREWFLHSRP